MSSLFQGHTIWRKEAEQEKPSCKNGTCAWDKGSGGHFGGIAVVEVFKI